jgi:hypothetical protein
MGVSKPLYRVDALELSLQWGLSKYFILVRQSVEKLFFSVIYACLHCGVDPNSLLCFLPKSP